MKTFLNVIRGSVRHGGKRHFPGGKALEVDANTAAALLATGCVEYRDQDGGPSDNAGPFGVDVGLADALAEARESAAELKAELHHANVVLDDIALTVKAVEGIPSELLLAGAVAWMATELATVRRALEAALKPMAGVSDKAPEPPPTSAPPPPSTKPAKAPKSK